MNVFQYQLHPLNYAIEKKNEQFYELLLCQESITSFLPLSLCTLSIEILFQRQN